MPVVSAGELDRRDRKSVSWEPCPPYAVAPALSERQGRELRLPLVPNFAVAAARCHRQCLFPLLRARDRNQIFRTPSAISCTSVAA